MSNLEVAKRFADLLESGDVKGLQVLLADNFRARGATRELTKQQALGYLQIFFAAFPDHSFGFADFEEKGDLIYCTGHETGTHKGVLDLNPFGMPISLPQQENLSNCRKAYSHFVWWEIKLLTIAKKQ